MTDSESECGAWGSALFKALRGLYMLEKRTGATLHMPFPLSGCTASLFLCLLNFSLCSHVLCVMPCSKLSSFLMPPNAQCCVLLNPFHPLP